MNADNYTIKEKRKKQHYIYLEAFVMHMVVLGEAIQMNMRMTGVASKLMKASPRLEVGTKPDGGRTFSSAPCEDAIGGNCITGKTHHKRLVTLCIN